MPKHKGKMNPEEVEIRTEIARDLFDGLRRRICKISDESYVSMSAGCDRVDISIDGDIYARVRDGAIDVYGSSGGEPTSIIELTNKDYKELVLDTMLMLM